jgi:glycosyltransferase involved in cell wall biosynthesis
MMGNVRVVRVPTLLRISKGVIMPRFAFEAIRLLREHDLVSVHLPQLEASLIAFLGRLARRPVILTYHCDLQLPDGLFNSFTNWIVFLSNYLAGLWAQAIVAYTADYANHSHFLSRFRQKLIVIPPPVDMPLPTARGVQLFTNHHGLDEKVVIGFAARFATEKGVEYLLDALPQILAQVPNAHVLFAGEHDHVIGEEEYMRRLQPLLQEYKAHWTFLGVLEPEEMANFFAACDLTVLPSINSTESFGLVQVESMLCGTPVCASNLPGVRVAIQTTGMGELVPPRDARALAEAILRILHEPQLYHRERKQIAAHFSIERTRDHYLQLFVRVRQTIAKPLTSS